MKLIAISLFAEEISPRFDCCSALAFADSEQAYEKAEIVPCYGPDGEKRLSNIIARKASVLICDGIRRCDWFRLRALGIEVFSGFQGKAEDLFKKYKEGCLQVEAIENPQPLGCRQRRRMQRKGG